ncbi:hypothetical protein [Variovorax sp. UC74_104]|uniref:hypothetical protein n=1 Tax=Variovorax sp. UC74_104 TaxID=3374555 RepID=UPI0037566564
MSMVITLNPLLKFSAGQWNTLVNFGLALCGLAGQDCAGTNTSLLEAAPSLPSKQRKAWLRQRILELFKYVNQPPRWLQSPAWPIGDAGPLVFLGQFPVADYFHDEAAVYVFHDPAKDAFTTFVQRC